MASSFLTSGKVRKPSSTKSTVKTSRSGMTVKATTTTRIGGARKGGCGCGR